MLRSEIAHHLLFFPWVTVAKQLRGWNERSVDCCIKWIMKPVIEQLDDGDNDKDDRLINP